MGGGTSGRTLSRRAWSQHAGVRCHRRKQPGQFGRCSVVTDAPRRTPSSTDSVALQPCAEVAFSAAQDSHWARHGLCVRNSNKAILTQKSGLGAKSNKQTNCGKQQARLRVTCRLGKGICRHKSLAFSPACCCRTTSRADPLQARMPPDGYPRRSPRSLIA